MTSAGLCLILCFSFFFFLNARSSNIKMEEVRAFFFFLVTGKETK